MLSKNIFILISTAIYSFSMTACDSRYGQSLPEENIIGERLDSISYSSGANNINVTSLFDETTGRVHSFDLKKMTLKNSFSVLRPDDPHYLIASNDSSFFVDLSKSQISIYNDNGTEQLDLIHFSGEPISSAYNQETGHLIVYDNLNSVSLLKINQSGVLEKSWVGGPIITGNSSILAGDITSSGDLILSLTGNALAVIDLDQSLDQEKWVYSLNTTVPHSDIKWISKVNGDLVLYQNKSALVLYDYINRVVLSQNDFPEKYRTLTYDKSQDPHIIYKNTSLNSFLIAYVEDSQIKYKELINHRGSNIFNQSRLDLNKNEWSYIGSDTDNSLSYTINEGFNYSTPKEHRYATSYRFNDMLVISDIDLPEGAQLKRSQSYVLALFPSELGYAEKIDIKYDTKTELKNFNIEFIDGDLIKRKQQQSLSD